MKSRLSLFTSKFPNSKIYNLGEGDPSRPLIPIIAKTMISKIKRMVQGQEFMGYTDPLGLFELRTYIADYYNSFLKNHIRSEEIFISDGAKADLFNIQTIFDHGMTVAVQNPSYPVYIDSLIINGNSKNIIYLIGNPENDFVPKLPNKKIDLFYICFPNNPTGSCANFEQLNGYVNYALRNKAIIIYDAVYSWFIQKSQYPKSIYEIPGAKECAIEIQSLSKLASFANIRLGWTIIPNSLLAKKFKAGQLNRIWKRRQQTSFNGPSTISQAGAIAALSPEGLNECRKNINYYMENAQLIKKTCKGFRLECYGGVNAPYVWVKTPHNMNSWDFFDYLLSKSNVICTPGAGFGKSGEGFFRLSGFTEKEDIKKALKRMAELLS